MPYAAPARVINAQRVNLIPLFTWWQQAESIGQRNSAKKETDQQPIPDRPMKAWVRIISVIKPKPPARAGSGGGGPRIASEKIERRIFFSSTRHQVDKRVESLVAEIAQLESSANSSRSSFENAGTLYARYNERRIDGETQRSRSQPAAALGRRRALLDSTRLGDLNAQLSRARDELKGLPIQAANTSSTPSSAHR